jgi:RNA polymerase sigma-70 factor (ECF subfamily)
MPAMPARYASGSDIRHLPDLGVCSKSIPHLSQKRAAACSSNVDAAHEGIVEMSFNDAKFDLETVFKAQYGRIARVIAGVIKDRARAEELAVEVFLKWERTPTAQGEGTEGWLYRAAVRVALNELRRERLRIQYERLLGFVTRGRSGGATPHEIYAAQEDQHRVRLVLSVMKPRQAELLLLRSNDFSYEELASILNLNPNSVGTLLSRALEAFRKEFMERFGKERHGCK